MTDDEKELVKLKEAGSIDQETFESLLNEIRAQENVGPPPVETGDHAEEAWDDAERIKTEARRKAEREKAARKAAADAEAKRLVEEAAEMEAAAKARAEAAAKARAEAEDARARTEAAAKARAEADAAAAKAWAEAEAARARAEQEKAAAKAAQEQAAAGQAAKRQSERDTRKNRAEYHLKPSGFFNGLGSRFTFLGRLIFLLYVAGFIINITIGPGLGGRAYSLNYFIAVVGVFAGSLLLVRIFYWGILLGEWSVAIIRVITIVIFWTAILYPNTFFYGNVKNTTSRKAPENSEVTAVVTSDALNLRSRASPESAIVTVLYKGNRITVKGDPEAAWVAVEFEGKSGFVDADYISIEGETSAPAAVPAPAQ